MFLWLSSALFFTIYVGGSKVCYPSVVRHRLDSIFPTSRLFCISKQNDELEYQNVEIVQDEEHWSEYSKSRWVQLESDVEDNPQNLLTFRSVSGVRLFKLPAAISASDFCQGTQNVEVNRNLTIRCKPLATSDVLSQCTENDFLSALALFGNGEFIQRKENETVNVERISPEQLRAPVWDGAACNGVVKSAHLHFFVNESQVRATEIRVEYANLPGNVDNKWFEQTFSVEFVEWKPEAKHENEEERTTNQTENVVGYLADSQIYRSQSSTPVPFAIPTIGHCYSGAFPPAPVLYLRAVSSVCTIPTSSCADARAKAKSFYEQVYPNELFSTPSGNAALAKVVKVNVTWEESSLSSSTCRLPVSSMLQIYHSKQGSTKNYRDVIVAGNVQLLLDDISFLPGQDIRMPLTITFTDVTPPPKSIFALLPYVDIRLPYDFFYPFISNSAHFCSPLFLTIFALFCKF